LDDACAALRAVAPAVRPEEVPLERALGRVLAAPVRARGDVPNLDVAAMDGYACRHADAAEASAERPARLRVVDGSRAGGPAPRAVGPGEAVAIATGAAIPEGADAIAVVERTRREGEAVLLTAPADRKHVRRAGEDLQRGVAALAAGTALDPVRLGLAASLGHESVEVARRPRVRVLTTGPELAAVGAALAAGEVHDSNGPLVAAALRAAGAEPEVAPRATDDEAALRRALDAGGGPAPDLIVTTGGASVGRYDVVRRLLVAEGTPVFDGILVRPGRPALLGRIAGVPWLALPGTPHAVAVLGTLLLAEWAHAALGRAGEPPCRGRHRAVCDGEVRGAAERTVLALGRTRLDEEGRLRVAPRAHRGASRLLGLAEADAVIVLPPGGGATAGETVEVAAFGGGVSLG
jgi:molybdopterin molybdotransferase